MTVPDSPDPLTRQPVVLRSGTVLTVDAARTVLVDTDVLVVDDRIAAVGPSLEVPEGTREIEARGGVVMPGMIDTHRHMWQTAMRGYGADWTLTQYFVWYYLEHGSKFRPQDVALGNKLAALECLDAGVTTCVDWSHGLQSVEYGEAAADALRSVPGRWVLAYGNIQQAPWEWTTSPDFQAFARRTIDTADDLFTFQIAFDVTGDPAFPERAAYEAARELGVPVTTHAGVWGATNDDGVRFAHEAGFLDETSVFVHAATLSPDSYQRIAASGGSVSVATESEQSAGQGYPPTWALRSYGIPVSLSMDTSVWWSGDLFSAMRTTLGADRSREHLEAHGRGDTVTHSALRSEEVVEWATRGGARAIGRDSDLGSIEVGRKADLVLLRNDHSPVSFPLLNPHGHVVLQAQRGDVHTVISDGRLVKADGRLVGIDLDAVRREAEDTVEYLRATIGPAQWEQGMNPEVPEVALVDNPYTYSDVAASVSRGG